MPFGNPAGFGEQANRCGPPTVFGAKDLPRGGAVGQKLPEIGRSRTIYWSMD